MEAEDPFYKAVLTKAKNVVGVAPLGRRPNAHQRSALDWLYPTCAAQGCGVRSTVLPDRPPRRLGPQPCHGS